MTGEITLSGRVLPVGGIKEKVLAARRVGIREVILPRQNEKNINEDLTEELRQELTVHYVQSVDEVLLLALSPAVAAVDTQGRASHAAVSSSDGSSDPRRRGAAKPATVFRSMISPRANHRADLVQRE